MFIRSIALAVLLPLAAACSSSAPERETFDAASLACGPAAPTGAYVVAFTAQASADGGEPCPTQPDATISSDGAGGYDLSTVIPGDAQSGEPVWFDSLCELFVGWAAKRATTDCATEADVTGALYAAFKPDRSGVVGGIYELAASCKGVEIVRCTYDVTGSRR